jgi:hypothetical protein
VVCVCVCDLEASVTRRSKTVLGRSAIRKQKIGELLKKPAVELAYWLKDIKHCKLRVNLVLQQFTQYPVLIRSSFRDMNWLFIENMLVSLINHKSWQIYKRHLAYSLTKIIRMIQGISGR